MKLVITVDLDYVDPKFEAWVRESGADPTDPLYHEGVPEMPLLVSVADCLGGLSSDLDAEPKQAYKLSGWTVYTEHGYSADFIDQVRELVDYRVMDQFEAAVKRLHDKED